jgi:hypothetical protein
MSAGLGAILTLLVDRVVRFFMERDRRADEIKIAEKLATIETQLAQLLTESKERGALSVLLARLDERIKALEENR